METTVFCLSQKPPTNTCLLFWATTCLALHVLTKVFTGTLAHDHLPFHLRKHLPLGEGNHLPPGFLPIGGWRPPTAILVLSKPTHA